MQLISTSGRSLHEFHLIDNQGIKEVLRYNPLQQSARISYQGYQRLFFVEQIGFRTGHMKLKNEYGVTIGTLLFEKGHENHESMLEVDGRRFQCVYHNKPAAELAIYDYGHNSLRPAIACDVQAIDWIVTESFMRQDPARREYASVLLGLCWYLHLSTPAAEKPVLQGAELPVA
jgi:hypothetical protein